MGLTRPGGPAAGLGEDFTISVADVPDKPEPAEPGRDLPVEIMRQICAHLDDVASPVMRLAIEDTATGSVGDTMAASAKATASGMAGIIQCSR